MAFVVRTAAEIRDTALTNLRARYLAAGSDLDIQEGSDVYNEFDALALEFESLELAAETAAERVLVRSTFGADLALFAEDLGTRPLEATSARRYVTVTGANSTTYTLSGTATLNASSGVRFLPIDTNGAALTSVTTNGSGSAVVLTEAQTDGTDGNLEADTVLTWSSTPSGMGATGTIIDDADVSPAPSPSYEREGEDAESDEDLQTRILEILRERPASGNRADWRARALEISGVAQAYVYPLVAPPASYPGAGTPHTPGCVTVVLLGPAQGDSTNETRVIGGTPGGGVALPAHKGYFEGTHDANQNPRTGTAEAFAQWRPVGMEEADYSVEAVTTQSQDVTAQLTLDASASWGWVGSAMTIASSTTTTITIAGDQTAKNGADALVFIGTANTRGGWTKINLGTGVFGGVNTVFTFTALAAAPDTSKGCYPAPSNWEALRLAAFAHFDALGPGDVGTDTYPRSARFPPESWGARAKLYRLRLAMDLMGVRGTLTAELAHPLADVSPALKTIVTLDEFLATQ